MEKGSRILLMGLLSLGIYFAMLYLQFQTPYVVIFSGLDGETVTEVFTIKKSYWDIKVTFFKKSSPFFNLAIEVYKEGVDDVPVYSDSVVLYTSVDGSEVAELKSHHSLPSGRYYLKIISQSVQWTIRIEESS